MRHKTLGALPELAGVQAQATAPGANIWLSASAGTGKTHVLSARVLRLLLNDVSPEAILCLTFTKAGASEMAERIHERLGAWVTMERSALNRELFALGEPNDDEAVRKARRLFARMLDARGGGLRIQTIHAFCQTILGAFPTEAGLAPGFRPLEGREESALAQQVLADLVDRALREGRTSLIERLERLALRLGEEGARAFLRRCAGAPDAMLALGMGPDAITAQVRRWLCGDIEDPAGWLVNACSDGLLELVPITEVRDANAQWKTKAGGPVVEGARIADILNAFLAAGAEERVALLSSLESIWLNGKGKERKAKVDAPGYADKLAQLRVWAEKCVAVFRGHQFSEILSNALILGQEYSALYAEAKRASGLVDFGDQIRATVKLLGTPGIGDWIRYKLDQSIDHLLVDEAQDTNAAQWQIVKSLTEEFFAGEGAKTVRRTLFTVGDYKQAIFGFQGTDPREFAAAQRHFDEAAEGADDVLHSLSLARSFRSSQVVLDLVDAVIDQVTPEALGLEAPDPRHVSNPKSAGSVTLWRPYGADAQASADDDEADDEAGDDVLDDVILGFARDLAAQVRRWVDGELCLGTPLRAVRPGEIMILVRSRSTLARTIVSQLYQAGVSVAGVDRLRLNTPLVVQDLLACIRFALQPGDDLALAALLVSPLIGWSQEDLLKYSVGRKRTLWAHLRATLDTEQLQLPYALLAMADLTTPYRFLETILSGPLQGRKRLLARLGGEARDPIDELLNAALAFESDTGPSLQLFLDWFDRGDVEIKRDSSKPENAVRVMTVHGAKGLQAPVVILADATSNPDFKRKTDLDWSPEPGLTIPLFRPRKSELLGTLADAAKEQDDAERREHWRLLYVAMTRAEQHLFIGGALTKRQRTGDKGIGKDCWYTRIETAFATLSPQTRADGALTLACTGSEPNKNDPAQGDEAETAPPSWLTMPAPAEARPPRPLAPSTLGADDEASPPPTPAMQAAAQRGRQLHALLERLPALAPEQRASAAHNWLEHSEGIADADTRAELVTIATALIAGPEFAPLFAPEALAEAPLAGVVDGLVISGTVDRLLITDEALWLIDYKTGRYVPSRAETAPRAHLRQMAAYAALLAAIFPGRAIRAGLLYTHGPKLISLSPALLAQHKPGLGMQQQELPTTA